MSRRAVFLDRDGVLNEPIVRNGKPYPALHAKELVVLEGAREMLSQLKRKGFLLIVVTNQPDVRRGKTSQAEVEQIHRKLSEQLPLDDFFSCFHDDCDACSCRKPLPGLLREAAAKYDIELGASYMVGDRWRDVDAGAAAGCRTVLIDYGYDDQSPSHRPDKKVLSLSEAVDWILTQENRSHLNSLSNLKVKIFADGADVGEMIRLARDPLIRGFTTNPTLMHNIGIRDYESFARQVLTAIPDRVISLEVFSGEFSEMERQALKIASWGSNVFVKIPVMNTRGESSRPLLCRLAREGVKLNVTAVMTVEQVQEVVPAIALCPAGYISIFAGRIADTGRDPVPLIQAAVEAVGRLQNVEIIWASPREVLNVFQANDAGCHVITATTDILNKLALLGKDLHEYSLETVKMFHGDAVKAGFCI